MTITWVPTPGQGCCKKCKIVGVGQEIDENNCIIKRGTFNENGELNCADGAVINYSDSTNVSIRSGVFNEGKENGEIYEYVFPKANWGNFTSGNINGVNATRYRHTFNNGAWVNTSETKNNNKVKGSTSKNRCRMNNWTSFNFEEI